jgi:hypothetical protein
MNVEHLMGPPTVPLMCQRIQFNISAILAFNWLEIRSGTAPMVNGLEFSQSVNFDYLFVCGIATINVFSTQ